MSKQIVFTFYISAFCLITSINAQGAPISATEKAKLHNGLSTGIGNFSLEILYHTSTKAGDANVIISPISIWTSLAVISEGAAQQTYKQLRSALRIRKPSSLAADFGGIAKYLADNTTTVELDVINTLFVDRKFQVNPKYIKNVQEKFQVRLVNSLNFADSTFSAGQINKFVSLQTHNKITELVYPADLLNTPMILTSAVFFKGLWKFPFDKENTQKRPFYDTFNKEIGAVNMMYRRGPFPYSNIEELESRIIEITYGKEDRLSLLVMLPYNDITLEKLFKNLEKYPLDVLFQKLEDDTAEYEGEEVDCYLPRFKISSNLFVHPSLQLMGIFNIFDQNLAELPNISRSKIFISKVIHKAEIEVTEEGTVAAAVTASEFANRNSVPKFEANRPFAYVIVEKNSNTIVFGGVYKKPELF